MNASTTKDQLNPATPLIRAEHLVKTHRAGSGSGRSTLLNMIGCLDHPSSGTLSGGQKQRVAVAREPK